MLQRSAKRVVTPGADVSPADPPTGPVARRWVRLLGGVLAGLCVAAGLTPAQAQKRYDAGANDSSVLVGQTLPYSGPASAYGTLGRVEAAYLRKVNDAGGILGRRITLISLDDAYSPPKTVEMTRRLVEKDEVLLLFNMVGAATNSAVHKYVNDRHIPHLLLATGASKFADPKSFPWSMPGLPTYALETRLYAKHILATRPRARIAALYQDDDAGRDWMDGLKEGLGAQVGQIVAEASFQASDATIDSQVIALQASGADVLVTMGIAKFGALAIRKVHDLGWKPTHYMVSVAAQVNATFIPAGVDKAVGVLSAGTAKDPRDPQWADHPGMKDYLSFMKAYLPAGDPMDGLNVAGYNSAQILVQILRQCGDDLTHDNVMRQAANLHDLQLPMLLPGIAINTSPTDYLVYKSVQMRRFDGVRLINLGEVIKL